MINTLTLNPAIDKILFLDQIVKGTTNRVKQIDITVGGKGTHVSMNLSIMGVLNRSFGLVYGENGKSIIRSLQELGVDTHYVCRDRDNSRTNYITIENSGECTIIAEKGVSPLNGEMNELIEQMDSIIGEQDYLVLSGDTSNFAYPSIYNRILSRLKKKNLKVFIDASGESLKNCLSESPFLIKPNQHELSDLCGMQLNSEQDVIDAIESLASYEIEVIAVSLGKNGAMVKLPGGIYKTTPPTVKALNTAGCGDCFLSGLLYGFVHNLPPCEMLKFATAVSAATAESFLSVGFDIHRANQLLKECQVKKIK